jgi:hypothetical protein
MGIKVNIKNGIEPYSYAWSCEIVPFGIYEKQTASDILNDTTLISPTITKAVWFYTKEIKFKLTVFDKSGLFVLDSVNVRFSTCGCLLGYQVVELNKGDSTLLDAGKPTGKITKLYWEPGYGLTNPDSSATWCKPDSSMNYFIVSIDTFGCSCSCHAYEIRVITTNSPKLPISSNSSLCPYQLGSKIYYNNIMNKEVQILVFSISGILLYSIKTVEDNIDLANVLNKSGLYVVTLTYNGNYESCKFLKE